MKGLVVALSSRPLGKEHIFFKTAAGRIKRKDKTLRFGLKVVFQCLKLYMESTAISKLSSSIRRRDYKTGL